MPQSLWILSLNLKARLVPALELWVSRVVILSVQFLIHASSLICICLVWRICMTPGAFLMCAVSVSERVLAELIQESSRWSPGRVSRCLWCHWCGPTAISSQLSRAGLLFMVPSRKADTDLTVASFKANSGSDLVLKIKNIHCPARSFATRLRLRCQLWSCSNLSPRLVWGCVYYWVCSQGRRQRHALRAWHFYV